MKSENLLYVPDREQWRAWLEEHHASETEVWLVYYKKHTGKPTVPYDDAVEEALCFGWIDSIVKKLDEDRYIQRFSRRIDNKNWSPSNRERLARLLKEGRMTPAGLAVLPPESSAPPERYEAGAPLPELFAEALKANPTASVNFHKMAPSYRRDIVRWVIEAKKDETRQRRLAEAIRLLERNQKLGMK